MTFDYDAELRLHNEQFRAAARVGSHDRVLDIGCGTGQTTREAADVADKGSVLGVDVSPRMIEQARRLSEGVTNVAFELADAQVHTFAPGEFDVCLSRYGTMFFADPVAAFANIGRALRPAGRLVLLVWQERARNEWATEFARILDAAPIRPIGPNAFSLADPTVTEGILTAAGFADVSFTDVREPVYYGADTASAFDAIFGLWDFTDRLAVVDSATAEQIRADLRDTLDAHTTRDGVYFDSRAWIVTARRIPPVGGRRPPSANRS